MERHGGFEHNAQSMRIVDVLEERYPRLSAASTSRGRCARGSSSIRPVTIVHRSPSSTRRRRRCLEAQIVDYADEIAYNAHDIDDGLKSGM